MGQRRTLDYEGLYAKAMLALAEKEGRIPSRFGKFNAKLPDQEADLDEWMVEVLEIASTPEGFEAFRENFWACGCPRGNENHRSSPLVTRGLVKVDKTRVPRRLFITPAGVRELKQRRPFHG